MSIFKIKKIHHKVFSNNFYQIHSVHTKNNVIPQMPDCRFKPSIYEGADYEKIKTARDTKASPSVKTYYKKPVLIHEGHAQWLWGHDGKRYLDMLAGIVTVAVGHSHPKITETVTNQMSKLGHTSLVYMQPRLQEYVEKLTAKLPEELNVVYLTNSGSEANDLAFLMARLHTKNHHIISLNNSYHGGGNVCSFATGMSSSKFPISPLPGFLHVTNPDVYLGPWGGPQCRDCPIAPAPKECGCSKDKCIAADKYFDNVLDLFRYSLPKSGSVAAFIAESIQGIGGTVQLPKTYLKQVFELVREKGGVCIIDEVQTGFGRTGDDFWGFEGHHVVPDIVTMAKGMGNGFPMGAVATTSEIAHSLNKGFYFNTYGGNSLACAVASQVLDIIDREELQANAKVVGTHMLNRLSKIMVDYPKTVGDVRGKGLMIGVELGDQQSKAPLGPSEVSDIFEDVKDMGVLLGKGGLRGNVLRIKPPMCISKSDADFAADVIEVAIQNHEKMKSLKKKC